MLLQTAHETALTQYDARADDRRREVAFADRSVVIARRISGIAMRVQVPLASYQGVRLSLASQGEGESLHDRAAAPRCRSVDPALSGRRSPDDCRRMVCLGEVAVVAGGSSRTSQRITSRARSLCRRRADAAQRSENAEPAFRAGARWARNSSLRLPIAANAKSSPTSDASEQRFACHDPKHEQDEEDDDEDKEQNLGVATRRRRDASEAEGCRNDRDDEEEQCTFEHVNSPELRRASCAQCKDDAYVPRLR